MQLPNKLARYGRSLSSRVVVMALFTHALLVLATVVIVRYGYAASLANQIFIVVAYLALSFSFAGITAWQMTAALKKLGLQSRRVASGDFASQLEVGTQIVEIQQLADDLNNMRRELVEQANRLEHQALHDALTALPNRVLLRDRVEAAIKKARREGSKFSLMIMDLDHFKEVNDTLGHPIGDMVLQLTAAKLRHRLRDCDTVARLGGDEFAVLIFTDDVEAAQHVAQKIREALERPLRIDELTLRVGGSIGIATYPSDGEDFETLLRRADVAMYTAKREGTGYALYEKARDPNSANLLSLTGELRDAIDGEDLTLYYQPKFRLTDKKIVGAEALIRWNHPSRGMVMPNDFIPLAEKSGLIEPLTNWVLKTAMNQTEAWEKMGMDVPLAVNISAKNLQMQSFPDTLASLFKNSKIKRQNFVLELTESALLVDPNQAIKVLEQFDRVGVRLSIDDFGTGYSSLAYLKRLPVRELKIDRVFVRDMVSNRNDLAIVTATIQMAHGLDLSVVAEGIEDEPTLGLLTQLGCDVGQGYFFSTPLTSIQFEEFWRSAQHTGIRLEPV